MTEGIAERLTGSVVGTVAPVDEILHSPYTGRVCIAKARAHNTRPTLGYDGRHYGVGVGFTRSEAYGAAIMEAVERSCMTLSTSTAVVRASVAELERRKVGHVAPGRLCHFLDEQYARENFPLSRPPAVEEDCLWLCGADLSDGGEILVPAEYCVDVPARASTWWQVTSSGLGAGSSPDAACLSGVLELVERDAVMAAWHQRIELPFIDVMSEGRSRLRQIVEERVEPSGLRCWFLDLSGVHGIPTCLALVWGILRGRKIYGIGSAAHLSWYVAIEKSLREALGMHYTATRFVALGRDRRMASDEIRSFADRVVYYLDTCHQVHLDRLTERSGEETAMHELDVLADPTDPSMALRWLRNRLGQLGRQLIAVDLSPYGGEMLGAHVYRVISPDLIPLNASHLAMPLRLERMYPDGMNRGVTEGLRNPPHPIT